jgi:hypothetical protein
VEEEEEPKEGEESKPEVINIVFPTVGIALFFLIYGFDVLLYFLSRARRKRRLKLKSIGTGN